MLKIEVNYEFKLIKLSEKIKELRNNIEKIDTFNEDDMKELAKLINNVNFEIKYNIPKKKEMIKTLSYFLPKQ